jgi:hypothetical protein
MMRGLKTWAELHMDDVLANRATHDTRTALNEEAKASGLPPGSMTGPGSRAPAVGSGFVSGDEAP